ncbi:MAG: hypothetical protein R2850_00995 [Bacteroidia bacterium]
MNSFNRFFGVFWGVFSVLSVLFWLRLQGLFSVDSWIEYTEWMLLLYLGYNSRSLRSKQSAPIWIAVISMGVALLFKFLHWPFTFQLLAFATAALAISYTYFYIRISNKKTLDFLKLSWVYFFLISRLLSLFHYVLPGAIKYVSPLLILIIYVWVSNLELKGLDQSLPPEQEKELPEDIL